MDEPDDGPVTPPEPGAVAPDTEAVQHRWEQVMADMEATADDYRERGWTVLELHPGDVAALGPDQADRWGLDLLLPDDEFGELETWVAGGADRFDTCEVLRGSSGGLLFLVVAMLDDGAERAVLFPAYYDVARAEDMLEAAETADELPAHLRPLTNEPVVTFTIDDPELAFPVD